MWIIAKAEEIDGRFHAWDTSSDAFYFKDWLVEGESPLWDRNQWWAQTFTTEQDAESVALQLAGLGYTVALLGGHGVTFKTGRL